ncbi:hypothetical protein [Yinghuangia soli]|uniref:Uncharacterized protein n=1 Tax=Yinghuangia soli TaxID=2908204 RepID=A0AA41Q7M6_9ACTN|nr:hypothetical protein [Yinghuangia soli]MCF2532415.1 hypothetical protein [Yinghuangia soli]
MSESLPLLVSHDFMALAHDAGLAEQPGPSFGAACRYQDFWWLAYADGWLRVTDPFMSTELDARAARLRNASAPGGT